MDNRIFDTENKRFYIRFALAEDVPIILQFIKELAEYEKMLHSVVATEELLHEWIFEKQKAEVLIGEYDGEAIGFAVFFHNFSTFMGRSGMYIEDLYINPSMRGKGFGKIMFRQLAKLAVERGCGRLDWWCLDWNHPGISFYLSLGAQPMSDWTVYRISGDKINLLAHSASI